MTDSRQAWRLCLRVGLPAIAVGLALTASYAPCPGPRRPKGFVRMDGWGLRELADHLRGGGLGLREVARPGEVPPRRNAYLTTTAADWAELELLFKGSERIASWRGTVFVEAAAEWDEDRVRTWGDCCLAAGPFLFFGDPDLHARIEEALRE